MGSLNPPHLKVIANDHLVARHPHKKGPQLHAEGPGCGVAFERKERKRPVATCEKRDFRLSGDR
jgi:hypothetical protein